MLKKLRLLREAVLAQLPFPQAESDHLSSSFPLAPSPAWQYAFALFLLVFGFLLGPSILTLKSSDHAQQSGSLLTAKPRNPGSKQHHQSLLLPEVNRIRLNPETGQIDIHYNTIADIALIGSTENSNVHLLLQKALVESEDSSVRLNALEAVQLVALEENGLNQDLIAALERLLFQEDNPGIRLLVLKIFEDLP